MNKPHVLVNVFRVEKQSFNPVEYEHYIAEVSSSGLTFNKRIEYPDSKRVATGQEDPTGMVGYGADEKVAKDNIREQLKEAGFSKKQIEYRRGISI